MSVTSLPTYPEHEKLQRLGGANNTVGDFLEWLQAEGYVIARYGAPYEVTAYVDYLAFERLDEEAGELASAAVRQIRKRESRLAQQERGEKDVDVPELPLERLGWMRDKAIELGVVIWKTTYAKQPGERGLWSNEIVLPSPDDLSEPWREVRFNEDALFAPHIMIEELIGAFFDIDARKLSEEKDQMLVNIRAANARREEEK